MKLESLPNEILLELFNYIDDIQLLCIFYNLNSRFNNLLFISSRQFSISQLTHLFKYTSHLENLSISIYQDFMDEIYIFNNSLTNILPSLTVLNINFQGTIEALEYILQNIPNLHYMKIEAPLINMNGHLLLILMKISTN
jgi:hypothetical protein